jgi:polyhydroxyalkanoate synthesis regulator phasin
MKNGLARFTFYIGQIDKLLEKASVQNDPASWLYANNARTPFFMLEGLAKLYSGIHNTKKFGKVKKQFKRVEDGLGQIDYYNWLSAALDGKKQITAACIEYIKMQSEQKAAQLNDMLLDKGWLSDDDQRIKKITNRLEEIDWMNPDEEVAAISAYYKNDVSAITDFVTETNYRFDNVETGVHELRRRLRWLSIYPQALQGIIQYADDTHTAAHLKKYLTPEIVNSPYNKLPAAGSNTSFLYLDKNNFLALSWMIDKLGKLKDEGLLVTGLCQAIEQTTGCSDDEALAEAYIQLGRQQRKMREILDEAETVTKTFFKEDNLKQLISSNKS